MKNPIISYLPHDLPRTGIMATIGSSNSDDETLAAMALEGATIFRFNAAQFLNKEKGPFKVKCFAKKRDVRDRERYVSEVIRSIRRLEQDLGRPLVIYLDLAGPKLRVRQVLGGRDRPAAGDIIRVYFDSIDLTKIRKPSPKEPCRVFLRDAKLKNFHFEEGKGQISFKDGWLVIRKLKKGTDKVGRYVEGRAKKPSKNFEWIKSDKKYRGVNVGCNPAGYLFEKITTDYDERVIKWAMTECIDVFSQSFVCHPIDAFRLRCIIASEGKRCHIWNDPVAVALNWPLIGKIETAPAVLCDTAKEYATKFKLNANPRTILQTLLKKYKLQHDKYFRREKKRFEHLLNLYTENPLLSLVEAFDGLMAARGDLAVEVPKESVPNIQRELVSNCRLRNKSSIIATEVLPSMQHGRSSTRSEIGDINTAVFQEADVIMLGGEVASLKPKANLAHQVVAELRKALKAAEAARHKLDDSRNYETRQEEMRHAAGTAYPGNSSKLEPAKVQKISMGSRVCNAARSARAPAIFVSVTTGATAVYISHFSPPQPVVAITNSLPVARSLLLHQGVYPVQVQKEFHQSVEPIVDIIYESHNFFCEDKTWPKGESVCPALLRIISASGEARFKAKSLKLKSPNSICEITLPDAPVEVPETEWKYLLTGDEYNRLRKELKRRYKANCQLRSQLNLYFSDKDRILKKAKISLRLRKEEPPDCRDAYEVFLTWKAPSQNNKGGFEMRPEVEYNVTNIYRDWKMNPLNNDFTKFSIHDTPTYLPTIFKRSEAYGVKLEKKPQDVKFILIGQLRNERLTVTTKSGVQLELDKWATDWGKEPPKKIAEEIKSELLKEKHELEIEDREENKEKVEEVIADLLASLRIKAKTGRNAKMLYALVHSGELPASVLTKS